MDQVENYIINDIIWNTSTGGALLLDYPGFEFDPASGWTSSLTTLVGRPATKHTIGSIGSIYIDDGTGGTFKYVAPVGQEYLTFEMTSFS